MRRARWWLALIWLALGLQGHTAAQLVVQGALTRQHDLEVGQAATGHITLDNSGDAAVRVRVTPADYTFDAGGQVRFGSPGQAARSNAGWMGLDGDLNGDLMTVPPHSAATLVYRLRVPATAPVGTSWSVLLLEPLADPAAPLAGLGQTLRYAVQIVTNVGAGGRPALLFTRPVVQPEGATLRLQLDLENHGERLSRPGLRARLCVPDGDCLASGDSPAARVYPDTAVRHTFALDLSGLPPGAYELRVAADDSVNDVFEVRYTLNWP